MTSRVKTLLLCLLAVPLCLTLVGCKKKAKTPPTTQTNTPPRIVSMVPTTLSTFTAGDAVALSIQASDPDRDALQYRFSMDGQALQPWGASPTAVLQTTAAQRGRHTITGEVKDPRGGSAVASADVYIFKALPRPEQPTPSGRVIVLKKTGDLRDPDKIEAMAARQPGPTPLSATPVLVQASPRLSSPPPSTMPQPTSATDELIRRKEGLAAPLLEREAPRTPQPQQLPNAPPAPLSTTEQLRQRKDRVGAPELTFPHSLGHRQVECLGGVVV